MRIYIMRHGEAHAFADSDESRALTPRGELESQRMASWLSPQLNNELDLVLVSPYLRAQQTWAACLPLLPSAKKVMIEDGITPYGQSEDVAIYLRALIGLEQPQSILLVSHLPLVGYLTAEFEQGIHAPMFPTSGISCIDYDVATEKSQLIWLENPKTIAPLDV